MPIKVACITDDIKRDIDVPPAKLSLEQWLLDHPDIELICVTTDSFENRTCARENYMPYRRRYFYIFYKEQT